jgi:glyoxylase-like metal-dependent hydrolase (beta-lactamase superfamily II)
MRREDATTAPVRVGSFEIRPVFDGVLVTEPSTFYHTTPDEDWRRYPEFLTPDGRLEFAFGALLVTRPDREGVVLVDLGIGDRVVSGAQGGQLPASLRDLGLRPDQVTDVVFTHLHRDHIGWATDEGVEVFTHATFRCHRADWVHFVDHGDREDPHGFLAGALLPPIAHRFEMWDRDCTILPGIDVQHAPGHTPGSSLVVLSDGTERAVLLGDVAHCPMELIDDDWEAIADVDPVLSVRTRREVARRLAADGVRATAAHLPGLRFGRLLEARGVRRWVVG